MRNLFTFILILQRYDYFAIFSIPILGYSLKNLATETLDCDNQNRQNSVAFDKKKQSLIFLKYSEFSLFIDNQWFCILLRHFIVTRIRILIGL